jgi:hypothetical protein
MDATAVVFEGESTLQPYFVFAFTEAFGVHLNTKCDIEGVQRPKFGPGIIENVEKAIDRARKTAACEKYADRTCVYVAPSSLSLSNEGVEFATGFAWALAFVKGRLIGADYKVLGDEPQAFCQPMANISACMARMRPVIAAPEKELKIGTNLVSAALEGLQIAHRLLESDYPSHRRLVQ